ncbi:retinol dehydrogenase 13-like isoform X1 [Schistocerca cancellata]|uniref:retinol dehydrogenase 13-like isoform X1 n=1 Tax=Schistocerca cancellata TaxID=274614 RepID=UPI0021180D4F|nr:retinol dehydrogenase 13-like isoform X1 [Schistocerca cancellata]
MGIVFSGRCYSKARLDNKTAIITGANTGIGKETALDLARRGATVVLACRDEQKAETAAEDLRKRLQSCEGAGQVHVQRLDLASLTSVRACARRLLEQHPKIHLLINNAGIMACPHAVTEDGFEMQLGVNHLGHFLLTCLLLPRLRASAPARIVNVSSLAHLGGSIDFDDLMWEKSYNATFAYARSKLANILFTKELGKRLEVVRNPIGTGVTAYSLHPGVVATELSRHFDSAYFPGVTWLFNNMARFVIKSPEQGAQTSIYCAVEESLSKETGLYYSDCRRTMPSRRARDGETARRLWEESARLVGLKEWDPCTAPDGSQPF